VASAHERVEDRGTNVAGGACEEDLHRRALILIEFTRRSPDLPLATPPSIGDLPK
jgi:hypothetical protein